MRAKRDKLAIAVDSSAAGTAISGETAAVLCNGGVIEPDSGPMMGPPDKIRGREVAPAQVWNFVRPSKRTGNTRNLSGTSRKLIELWWG